MIEAPELPGSHREQMDQPLRVIDGVLEAWQYDISRRQILVRHDAIVNGVRCTVAGEPIPGTRGIDLEAELRGRRYAALLRFTAEDEKRLAR